MNIDVQGTQVEVDNDFANLSPDEQQKTIDDISTQIGQHETVRKELISNQEKLNAPPSGFFDMNNPESGARKILDPTLAYGSMIGNVASEHPLLAGGAVLGAVKYKELKDVANKGLQAVDAFTTSRNFTALQGLEHQVRQYQKMKLAVPEGLQNAVDSLRTRVAGPVTPTVNNIGEIGEYRPGTSQATVNPTVNNIGEYRPGTPQGAQAFQQQPSVNGPVTPTVNNIGEIRPGISQATVNPQAQPMGTPNIRTPQPSILDHAGNIVRKLALSKILPAASIGMELFGTSPEEIDTLKKAEALKRAQGWKPLNER